MEFDPTSIVLQLTVDAKPEVKVARAGNLFIDKKSDVMIMASDFLSFDCRSDKWLCPYYAFTRIIYCSLPEYAVGDFTKGELASEYNHSDMNQIEILSGCPFAATVCDPEGILIYMNAAAEALFVKDGGRALLGTNLYDCHSSESQEKIRALMRDRASNVYTVEKRGKKRLIYQAPWYQDGEFAGLVEISFEIPPTLPNFKRE
jgi:PAS domain-containing protein